MEDQATVLTEHRSMCTHRERCQRNIIQFKSKLQNSIYDYEAILTDFYPSHW